MNHPASTHDLAQLLVQHHPHLLAWVGNEAGLLLLRFETAEDLVQGIHHEALRANERFVWQGEEAFLGWLFQIGRRYLFGRRDHWFAIKRNGARVLRLTSSGQDGHSISPINLTDTATGPATFAFRREQLLMAAKAIALLLPRDREIVQWTTGGVSLQEQAARLGLTIEAAQRAKSRAIERLQKAYRIVTQ